MLSDRVRSARPGKEEPAGHAPSLARAPAGPPDREFLGGMLTATVLVTAAVGDLWQYGLGLAAALTLCAALFLIFAVLFVRAPQRRR